MAIVVEMKGCCRKQKMVLKEGMFDDLSKWIGGTGPGKAVKTYIQEFLAEAIFEYLFGPLSDDAKSTIIYKTIRRTVGMLDLKDFTGLISGEQTACKTLTKNLIVSILGVVNNEIVGEFDLMGQNLLSKFNPEAGSAGSAGKSMLDLIRVAITNIEPMLMRVLAEKIKDENVLNELSQEICNIKFKDLIKDIPGAETLMSFFDE